MTSRPPAETALEYVLAVRGLDVVETATLQVVMLPYLHVSEELTLWQHYCEGEQAATEAGG
jgi:hypothetical protein